MGFYGCQSDSSQNLLLFGLRRIRKFPIISLQFYVPTTTPTFSFSPRPRVTSGRLRFPSAFPFRQLQTGFAYPTAPVPTLSKRLRRQQQHDVTIARLVSGRQKCVTIRAVQKVVQRGPPRPAAAADPSRLSTTSSPSSRPHSLFPFFCGTFFQAASRPHFARLF